MNIFVSFSFTTTKIQSISFLFHQKAVPVPIFHFSQILGLNKICIKCTNGLLEALNASSLVAGLPLNLTLYSFLPDSSARSKHHNAQVNGFLPICFALQCVLLAQHVPSSSPLQSTANFWKRILLPSPTYINSHLYNIINVNR